MKKGMMKRACEALLNAKSIGDVYFSCVFVVGDELTFSRKVAERMVEDARAVRLAELRKQDINTYWNTLKADIPIDYETVTFEEAYNELNMTDTVPDRVMKCVYKEMDAICITDNGSVYIPSRDKDEYKSAMGASKEIRREEQEQQKRERAERVERMKINKKLAEKKKEKKD